MLGKHRDLSLSSNKVWDPRQREYSVSLDTSINDLERTEEKFLSVKITSFNNLERALQFGMKDSLSSLNVLVHFKSQGHVG